MSAYLTEAGGFEWRNHLPEKRRKTEETVEGWKENGRGRSSHLALIAFHLEKLNNPSDLYGAIWLHKGSANKVWWAGIPHLVKSKVEGMARKLLQTTPFTRLRRFTAGKNKKEESLRAQCVLMFALSSSSPVGPWPARCSELKSSVIGARTYYPKVNVFYQAEVEYLV